MFGIPHISVQMWSELFNNHSDENTASVLIKLRPTAYLLQDKYGHT